MANPGLRLLEVGHAPARCRAGDGFTGRAHSFGRTGARPFDAAAIKRASSPDPACSRWHRRARERAGSWRMAKDGTILAQAMAAGPRRALGCRTTGRCTSIRKAADIHGRADLRDRCDDLREAVGERPADQPMEPTRDCRRGHKTGPGPERLAALSGALFKKEA